MTAPEPTGEHTPSLAERAARAYCARIRPGLAWDRAPERFREASRQRAADYLAAVESAGLAVVELPKSPDEKRNLISGAVSVHVQVTTVEVCAIPDGIPGRYAFALCVEYRGVVHEGKPWAVTWDEHEWNAVTGEWDYWRQPEGGDPGAWLAVHRFDYQTAMAIAAEQCHKLAVGDLTPAGVIARHSERSR